MNKKVIITFGLMLMIAIMLCSFTDDAWAACNGVETSLINCGEDESGIGAVLGLIINILVVGIGIAGVIGVTVAGIQYLTAGGSEEQTRKAKRRLYEIVIGFAAYVLLFGFLQWLIPGGILNPSDLPVFQASDNSTKTGNSSSSSGKSGGSGNKIGFYTQRQNTNTEPDESQTEICMGACQITKTAFLYAWPSGDEHNYWTAPRNQSMVKVPNDAYKAALIKWTTIGVGAIAQATAEASNNVFGQGASCDVFVGTVVRSVTGDTNFPFRGPGVQRSYARRHPELYEEIDYQNNVANLQPGDLMFSSSDGVYGHAQIFCGTTSSGKPMICEAAYEAHTGLVNDVRPNIYGFAVFRYKGE